MLAGRKLLLADDSITIQKVVALTFSDEGAEVETVSDGHEAIEKLKELWKAGVPADMISQTLAMPEHQVRAKAAELGLPQHVEIR